MKKLTTTEIQSVKNIPAVKMYLNDTDMELATRKTEKFEKSFLLYREAASGANGGKNGGGCGCN